MKKYIISLLLMFSTFLYGANGVVDKDTVLDFEGITTDGSVQEIGDKYKEDYGITFSPGSLVVVDSDDGGTGNFANEEAPGHTIAFFTDAEHLIMNVEKGFTHGFSFYYSAIDYNGTVVVYVGLDVTGKPIGTLNLTTLTQLDEETQTDKGYYNVREQATAEFEGTAKSVSFAGVANKIGFDKISFNGTVPAVALDVSLSLEDITRDSSSDTSDTFKIKFENVKLLSDGSIIENFCYNYFFKVTDENNSSLGASQISYGDDGCLQDSNNKNQVEAFFDINFIDGTKNYFENGIVEICDRSTRECEEIKGIEDFSVYGTNFNIKYHAFSFPNGAWNKADRSNSNNIAYSALPIIDEYIKPLSHASLWDNIGWTKDYTVYIKDWLGVYVPTVKQNSEDSHGLCHGMAYASIANFNHSESLNVWGIGGDVKTEWTKQIKEHELKLKTSPRPFNADNIYSTYSNNDTESFKKIIYYFITQSSYLSRKLKGNWIGSYAFDKNIENEASRKFLIDLLKNGKPFSMRFSLAPKGGHAVVGTQLIRFNDTDKWYNYDNVYPDGYKYFLVNDNKSYTIENKNNTIRNSDSSILYTIKNFGGRFSDDPLNIYNIETKENESVARSITRNVDVDNETYEYNLFNHISLSLIGGRYLSVKEKTTNEALPLLPIIDNLEEGKAYSDNANIFSNKLYLPNTSIYEVTVQKDASFPFLKLFAKVPNENGEIEIINYENIQSSEDSDTVARFYVGVDNTDKSMKRDDGNDYAADYNQTMPLSITPVESLQASLLTTGVNLLWINTQHPNLKETVIVRKEGNESISPTDGTVLYTGLDENYLDTTIDNNKLYYYTAFSISETDEVSQATSVSTDTYKYSVYGTTAAADSVGITNVQATLLNSDNSSTISISTTDENGNYSFNNLTNGTYNVDYQHAFYQSISQEIKVEDVSFKADQTLVGLPYLAIEANNGFKIGSIESIYWDGKNISDEQVNIKLFRNDTWETIFENIDFADKSVKWRVTAPADENATLQISLVSDNTILTEKEVNIGNGSVNYDLNHDGKIDIVDIMQVASKWNSKQNDGKYELIFDFNNDGKIDIVDIMSIVSKWGL